jgi:hypothetical protein
MKRSVLIASLAANVFFVAYYGCRKIAQITTPDTSAIEQEQRVSARIEALQLIPVDSSDTVFIGCSLTAELPTTHKNFGIHSARSCHIGKLIEHCKKAKSIYVLIGINDIVNGSDNLKANVQKFLPYRNIIMQAILPVSGQYDQYNNTIREYNQWLKEECLKQGRIFIDLYPYFQSDGRLKGEYSIDGLHLTRSGYEKWKSLLN